LGANNHETLAFADRAAFGRIKSMTMAGNGSASSYAAVAVAAALVSAAGTWGTTQFVTRSVAQPAAGASGPLLTQPLADLPGREVRISLLDREPRRTSARHRHPGHHVFGYVIEGTYEFGINGEPARTLRAGEIFYEPPTAIHTTSRNPSTDKHAKILIFMVADQKNPSTVAE
jgi:quercetin dioxygenase-like cupin family protein